MRAGRHQIGTVGEAAGSAVIPMNDDKLHGAGVAMAEP